MNEVIATKLNELLRGELAATETYQQPMAKVGADAGAEELRRAHVEHREAANTLRQHVHKFGGKPDQGSGARGALLRRRWKVRRRSWEMLLP